MAWTRRSVAVAALGLAATASGAGAATPIGGDLPPAPTGPAISCPWGTCITQISSSLRVPVSGVVTSWRTVQSAPAMVRLVRRRGTTTEVHEQPDRDSPIGAGPQEIRAQLKVTEGDRLGLWFTGTFTGTAPAAPGASTTFDVGNSDTLTEPVALLFNATIEPDADGDGLGDETQDSCPTRFSYGCPAFTFAADAPPPALPGATVTRTVTITNTGPGVTETGTFLSIRGKGGISATVDGAACPPEGGSGAKLRCVVDRVAVGRALRVVITVPDVRGPQNTFSVGFDGPGRRYWPTTTRAFERFSTPVPTLDDLRPTVRVPGAARRGRLAVRVGCPATGTQACTVRVGARLSGRGATFGTRKVTIRQGTATSVRVVLPRSVRARLRARARQVSVTAVRLDLPSGALAVSGTGMVRAR